MYESVQLPATWAQKSYNNKPYYLVEVSKYNEEWENVENKFAGYNVTKVERVQNPFQYGRYMLYKLQKNNPSEKHFFMAINKTAHKEIALRYNCDYRRLGYDKDKFFETASSAVSYASSCQMESNVIVVLQGLAHYFNHDSGRYAKYVVTYEPKY